ncbi:ABC transporter permease [Tepidimonas sp.]|uniref:ABC transporter permease n=1 Tax=Tepidimonas sp. TaxID=2002775 RepID=UPI002FE393E8
METWTAAWQQALLLIWTGEADLWSIVGRSLAVSGLATLLGCTLGLPLGAWLAVARFPGHGVVVTVLHALLAVPSVVVGLLVYLLLSRAGPLGALGWLFSFQAMVLAQTALVVPIAAGLTRQVVEGVDRSYGEQLRALGAGAVMRAGLLAWDERHALLTVVIVAFSRAVSEVGAVMIVGGNIEGYTRVMTTAIALETSKGDLPMALGLGLVLLGVVLGLHASATLLRAWAQRAVGGAVAGVAA